MYPASGLKWVLDRETGKLIIKKNYHVAAGAVGVARGIPEAAAPHEFPRADVVKVEGHPAAQDTKAAAEEQQSGNANDDRSNSSAAINPFDNLEDVFGGKE